MVAKTNHCNRYQLELLLAGELDERAHAAVAQHLETCSSCRNDLEQLAGDERWWADAGRLLRADADGSSTSGLRMIPQGMDDFSAAEPGPVEFALDFLEPSDNPAMLGRLGAYEILEVIGRGGMGVVLKGYQRELNRYVAIKVMAPHYAGSSAARKRFVREAKAAAAIVHPHVAAIHAVDADAQLPYLVMPYVACRSLQQIIDDDAPLELTEILRVAKQTAEGLAAAHAQGLVHRDVKPANILLEDDVGRVLLTDFGLARAIDDASMTRSGVIAGTPQYMSPEQADGGPIDHRSDLFSLGSVLYAMSTGHPPFRAETAMGVLRRICEDEPRPLREVNSALPAWFERLVGKLLAKEPTERFSSAAEVAELLEQCLAHVRQPGVNPVPVSLEEPPSNNSSTPVCSVARRMLLATCAGVLVIAAGWVLTSDGWTGASGEHGLPSAAGSQDEALSATPDSIGDSDGDSFSWIDDTDALISDLDVEISRLEFESDDSWETAPAMEDSRFPHDTIESTDVSPSSPKESRR